MGESGSKKRKRDGEASGKPKKKVVLDVPPPTATVSSVVRPILCPPVVATAPGIELPPELSFRSYQPRNDPTGKSKSTLSNVDELLLHSTAHPSLDYTGTEETPRGPNALVNHYVGIYDPKTGKLQVVEAKRMIVRGQVRSRQEAAALAKANEVKQNAMQRKVDLGQAFGTKKAKKAIRENELNSISPVKKGEDGAAGKMDNASRAMLSSVGAVTSLMATREELQAVVDEAKPVPKANLEATTALEVYDAKEIIGADILNLVPIQEWQEKVRHGENVQVSSRFVAARVNRLVMDEDGTTRLRVLRYLELVLLFYFVSKEGKQKGTRRVPPAEKLREIVAGVPDAVMENIRRKFSDAGTMRKFHVDLLMTHCCAFALLVDKLEVRTQELREDLKLGEDREMNRYFHEVGGRVKRTKDKATGQSAWVAKLELPLDFPKQRRIAPRKR